MKLTYAGPPMRGFVFMNPAGLATAGELNEWLELALEFNPKAKAVRKESVRKPIAPPRGAAGGSASSTNRAS